MIFQSYLSSHPNSESRNQCSKLPRKFELSLEISKLRGHARRRLTAHTAFNLLYVPVTFLACPVLYSRHRWSNFCRPHPKSALEKCLVSRSLKHGNKSNEIDSRQSGLANAAFFCEITDLLRIMFGFFFKARPDVQPLLWKGSFHLRSIIIFLLMVITWPGFDIKRLRVTRKYEGSWRKM